MARDLLLASPLLVLLGGAVLTLVVGIFLPRPRQGLAAALAGLALAAALVAVARLAGRRASAFDGTLAVDGLWLGTQAVLYSAALAALVLLRARFRGDAREAESYVMVLFMALGGAVLAGAADLMELVLGVLLTSVPAYALVGWQRRNGLALEAALKYYLFGALTNVGLVYGAVLLYALSGTTRLAEMATAPGLLAATGAVLVVTGIGFKGGFVPAHFWIPDVYQGATPAAAALISVVPKLAGIAALARWAGALGAADGPALIGTLAALTMSWGNIAALRTRDLRRLLAYSSIAHSGYLLMAVAAWPRAGLAQPALLYHFGAYAAANLGAFAVAAATGRYRLEDGAGLARQAPLAAGAMLIALLSLLGLPPLAGFVGKYLLLAAAWQAGLEWLVVLAAANTVLSLYYYLRVLAPMFLGETQAPLPVAPAPARLAAAAALASIVLGVGAGWVLAGG